MSKEESELNIRIDPKLLLALKLEAIKNGKTLETFITERLNQDPLEDKRNILEEKLTRIENELNLLNNFKHEIENRLNQRNCIFSDSGAKKYGEIAKQLFELHKNKKKLSFKDAFGELSKYLEKGNSHPELVLGILSGNHVLTGLEMTNAYRNGSCGMRNALHDWTDSSLEKLNEAFLNAVMVENLD